MGESNQIGIGIGVRSDLAEVMMANVAATKELTAAIQGLSGVLSGHAAAAQSVVQSTSQVVSAQTQAATATTQNVQATQQAAQANQQLTQSLGPVSPAYLLAMQGVVSMNGQLVNWGGTAQGAQALQQALTQATQQQAQAAAQAVAPVQQAAQANVQQGQSAGQAAQQTLQQAQAVQQLAQGVTYYNTVYQQAPWAQPGGPSQIGAEWEKTFSLLGRMGSSTGMALSEIEKAIQRGTSAQTMFKDVSQERFNMITRMVQQEGLDWEQLAARLKQIDLTHRSTTEAASTHLQAMRGLRFALMEGVFAFSMLQIAMGEQLPPAAREASRALMLVGDGLMAGAMMGGKFGPVVGAVSGLLLALGIHALAVDEDVAKLNKTLEQYGKKDTEIQTLMRLGDVTYDQGAAALQAMKENADYASTVGDLVKQADPASDRLQKLGDTLAAVGKMARAAVNGLLDFVAGLERIAIIEDIFLRTGDWNRALDESAKRMKELHPATQDVTEAQKKLRDALLNAPELNKASTAWRTYGESVADANRTMRDAIHDMGEAGYVKFLERMEEARKISRQMDEDLADQAQSRSDKLYDIQENLTDKLADEAYKLARDHEKIARDRVKDENEAAQKILDIEHKLAEQLADLDWSTGMSLRKAKTQWDKEEIEERSLHERSVKIRDADDDRTQAQRRLDDQKKALEEHKKDIEEDVAHTRMVYEREASEQRSREERTYRESLERIRQRNRDQLDDQARRLVIENEREQDQLDQVIRRNKEALDDAKRRYENELADSQKRYTGESTAIQAMTTVALRSWADREHALGAEKTKLNDVATAHREISSALEEEIANVKALNDWVGELWKQWSDFIWARTNPTISAPTLQIPAGSMTPTFQHGANFIVPPGFEGDRFPIRVSSGEHVSVTPAGQSAPHGPITFIINESRNARETAREVQRILQTEVFR